jgi:hypothetical protein
MSRIPAIVTFSSKRETSEEVFRRGAGDLFLALIFQCSFEVQPSTARASINKARSSSPTTPSTSKDAANAASAKSWRSESSSIVARVPHGQQLSRILGLEQSVVGEFREAGSRD